MRDLNQKQLRIYITITMLMIVFLMGCNRADTYKSFLLPQSKPFDNIQTKEIAVSAPPFSEGIFPCSECHDYQDTDPERRTLGMHDEIDEAFDHDSENRWCLDCHDATKRDFLRLASGKLLDFKESYKLCGQCHGDKLRDWKVGVHGKRTGEWNGKKQYFLCVHCHNPHSPKFKKIQPEPPPIRQEDL